MKYTNIVGRTFDFTGFDFTCKEEGASRLSTNRGSRGQKYPPVSRYWAYTGGPFNGQEFIGELGGSFFYPISELERTGQLSDKDLLINTSDYAIF